ncbi:hypothetical protein Clacol_006868 [Clathrus columnatus]|uniref:Tetraspanin n=1 Tax=Clathrus columnatus TaxID=1419009 RepID=A0AAV5AL22_9AGAM|nr:hypothetical protein Clacol_006868 [Clathrus columnatus]
MPVTRGTIHGPYPPSYNNVPFSPDSSESLPQTNGARTQPIPKMSTLAPPSPFSPTLHHIASAPGSLRADASMRSVPNPFSDKESVSLSVNYLPSKFSRPHSPGSYRRRKKGDNGEEDVDVPKRGGGREAFRTGEARMPGLGDEDYDGVMPDSTGKRPRMRWNKFKWTLFCSNLLLSLYSLGALVLCLMTWFNIWTHADIVRVANRPELILSTFASTMGLITSLVGWSGILLNNRAFLAVYNVLLWISFIFLLVPGYLTYKRRTFNLEGKLNSQWSRDLGLFGRERIQNALTCCGYFSPFTEATISQSCYSRSTLPGCKGPYLDFERLILEKWYIIAFAIVPAHIGVIVIGLLCSNHVTYRFGKGMMPKAYRLSLNSMAVIMDNYASQLAEQYGADVASEVLARSKHFLPVGYSGLGLGLTPRGGSVNSSAMASQANLETVPMMSYDPASPYSPNHPQAITTSHIYGGGSGNSTSIHRTGVHPANSDDRL